MVDERPCGIKGLDRAAKLEKQLVFQTDNSTAALTPIGFYKPQEKGSWTKEASGPRPSRRDFGNTQCFVHTTAAKGGQVKMCRAEPILPD